MSTQLDAIVVRQVLSTALRQVGKVVPRRSTLPVLEHVLIEAEGVRTVRVTGTDLDVRLAVEVEGDVAASGAVVVPLRTLADVLKTLPAKQAVRLEVVKVDDREVLTVAAGGFVAKLAALPVSEFPGGGLATDSEPVRVKGQDLREIVRRTASCASTEESRPIINGTLLELRTGALRAVATNGHQMSLATVVAELPTRKEPLQFILPPVATDVLASELPEEVTISWDVRKPRKNAVESRHLCVAGEGFELRTRLIEGPYPHYEQVIPRDGGFVGGNDKVAIVEREVLADVVKRMRAVQADSYHPKLIFALNGACSVSAKSPDAGNVVERLPAMQYDGAPLEIAFSTEYLSHLLKLIPAGNVRLTFSEPERAATLASANREGAVEHLMLLMPVRVYDT